MLLCGRCEQTEHGDTDRQRQDGNRRRESQCSTQSSGQLVTNRVDVVRYGARQLHQRGKGDSRLGLDAARVQHAHLGRNLGRIVPQGGLADSGLAPHDEGATTAIPGGVEQRVDPSLLALAPDQPACAAITIGPPRGLSRPSSLTRLRRRELSRRSLGPGGGR